MPERSAQWMKVAILAGFIAGLAAIATGRLALPRWVRITLVTGLVLLAGGVSLYAYRYVSRPVTLTVAAGSIDGDAVRLMSAIAARMTATGSPVRLKVLAKDDALDAAKAFSSGQADLAVARDDVGDLSAARAVVLITHGVAMLLVPPGTAIDDMDKLKDRTVGVVALETNQQLVNAIANEYDLAHLNARFRDVAPKDVAKALQSKQIQAVLVVTPISEKYLAMIRDFFPKGAKRKPGLVAIDAAGAIAAVARAYESYELPKGTLRGSPPIPEDDLTTLRVPYYLVAKSTLDKDTVTALTRAVMETRRDLISEYPVLAQISAPSTDKDAYIPIHPGAAAYFGGDQQTFFDKYGDQIFYGSMLLGSLTSLFAGAWKFMVKDAETPERHPLRRLYELADRIGEARGEGALAKVDEDIDDVLRIELEKRADGAGEPTEIAALGLVVHRLERLLRERRSALEGKSTAAPPA